MSCYLASLPPFLCSVVQKAFSRLLLAAGMKAEGREGLVFRPRAFVLFCLRLLRRALWFATKWAVKIFLLLTVIWFFYFMGCLYAIQNPTMAKHDLMLFFVSPLATVQWVWNRGAPPAEEVNACAIEKDPEKFDGCTRKLELW